MAALVTTIAIAEPRAIIFGDSGKCFKLTPDGLKVEGKPTFPSFRETLHAARYLEERSPFWMVDLLAYAKTRPDWERWLDQIVDAERYTKKSADRMASLGKRILPPGQRVDGMSLAHHAAVVTLSPEAQVEVLEAARADHLSADETFERVKKLRGKQRILRGQASELAKAQEKVQTYADAAVDACKAIARDDSKHAEKCIALARRNLEWCADAVTALRKAQGRK